MASPPVSSNICEALETQPRSCIQLMYWLHAEVEGRTQGLATLPPPIWMAPVTPPAQPVVLPAVLFASFVPMLLIPVPTLPLPARPICIDICDANPSPSVILLRMFVVPEAGAAVPMIGDV